VSRRGKFDTRERVEAAFRFKEVYPVPYHIWIEPEVEARLDAYHGTEAWRDKLIPYLKMEHFGAQTEEVKGGVESDHFGVLLEWGSILHVLHHPLSEPSLRGYTWPDPETIGDWDQLREACERASGSHQCLGLAFRLFERAWLLRGMQYVLMDMIDHPSFVEELLDGILDFHLKVMDIAVKRLPINVYFGGDDWCDQRVPIMGLSLWRRFFKVRLAELIGDCHDLGLRFMCHACGNVLPLVDDLLEIEMDVLESLQPEAMDVYVLKRKTAGRMVLVGGIGAQSTLSFGTPDSIRTETQRLIREMGRGGGYVVGPARPLLADVPTENAVAFIEAICEQEGV